MPETGFHYNLKKIIINKFCPIKMHKKTTNNRTCTDYKLTPSSKNSLIILIIGGIWFILCEINRPLKKDTS